MELNGVGLWNFSTAVSALTEKRKSSENLIELQRSFEAQEALAKENNADMVKLIPQHVNGDPECQSVPNVNSCNLKSNSSTDPAAKSSEFNVQSNTHSSRNASGTPLNLQNIPAELQQMVLKTCDLKVQRLNLLKQILETKNKPEMESRLKRKHEDCYKQELSLYNEIDKLKKIQKRLKIQQKSRQQDVESLEMDIQRTPHVDFEQVMKQEELSEELITSSDANGKLAVTHQPKRSLQKIWSGKLVLENCPSKGKSKDILVSGFAPNLTNPNLAPLLAQFEERASSNTSDIYYSHADQNFEWSTMAQWPRTLRMTGVCVSSNLNFFKKYSLHIFVLYPESPCNVTGNAEMFNFLLQQLNKNSWAGVVDLPQNTLLLVPFRQEKLLGIVLTKMNVTKLNQFGHEPPPPPLNLSLKYNRECELEIEDKIADGFYDPGRGEFLSLEEYQRQPVNLTTREILLVDSRTDVKLKSYVHRAQEMLHNFADVESQARVLALFVSNCFGGDFPNATRCAQEIAKLKQAHQANVIPIGEIVSGVCRHRAILYKYLCDRLDIDCELKRGTFSSNNITGGHAWNVIKLGTAYFVVDIMHEPTQLYPIDSEKAKNYTRVGNTGNQLKVFGGTPIVRPELSSRRFIRLPNLREKAVFHERLGRGGYGAVYRITLGGLSCALKKIKMSGATEQLRQYALQEVQVMEMLQHENIIHYLGHEFLEDKQELDILMELFPLSLGQLVEKRRTQNQSFDPMEIKHLAIEILNGIDYLHSQRILHRDLKPGNILVDMDEDGRINKVKITDFGVCKIMSDNNTDHIVGTELFMAPEVHLNGQYSTKADVWSFGMVLVELITLAPPYDGQPREATCANIRAGIPPRFPRPEHPLGQKIVELIESCLQLDPEKRPTAEQLILGFFRLQCESE